MKKPGIERGNAEVRIGEIARGGAHHHDEGDRIADGQETIGKDEADVRRRPRRIEDIGQSTAHHYQTAKQARR